MPRKKPSKPRRPPREKKPKPSAAKILGNERGPRRFRSAGSKEEFWRRCEEAARLHSQGWTYGQLAARYGVKMEQAAAYARRYFTAIDFIQPGLEQRHSLHEANRQTLALIFKEYVALDAKGADGKYLHYPTLSDADRIAERRKFLQRAESLVDKEAELFGFKRPALELALPASVESLADLPALLDQDKTRRLRAGLRALDRIERATEAEVELIPEKEADDGTHAQAEGPGGDPGDGRDAGGPVEGDADRGPEAEEEGFTVGAG